MRLLATYLIHFYQYCISPFIPSACRYSPTCSEYMIDAIKKHGFLNGTRLGIWRLFRCQPWGKHGFDPVPDKIAPNQHNKR